MLRKLESRLTAAFFYYIPFGNLLERLAPMDKTDIYYTGWRDGFAAAQAYYTQLGETQHENH